MEPAPAAPAAKMPRPLSVEEDTEPALLPNCCCFLITGSEVTELLSAVRSTEAAAAAEEEDDEATRLLDRLFDLFLPEPDLMLLPCSLSERSFLTAWGLSAPNLLWLTRRLCGDPLFPAAAAAASSCSFRCCSAEAELVLLSAEGVGLGLRLRIDCWLLAAAAWPFWPPGLVPRWLALLLEEEGWGGGRPMLGGGSHSTLMACNLSSSVMMFMLLR